MNYAKMSNCEIDRLIALKQLKNSNEEWQILNDGEVVIGHSEMNLRKYSPSSSWRDAGPIIESNEISINSIFLDRPLWEAFAGPNIDYTHVDENPLRAAMIVYLNMAEGV